ncbi:hypothetical protein VP01_86g1 [Puccinia sorghi]|uniref:FAD/NAD(P)-binding domain-containing protein n=1 Tax=Puccinia sorghi TaxID=27349 RepID=A0A0L6U9G0_9BASI|nr:hypothetical protein VP01_86g1 [Puccinia sorghi]
MKATADASGKSPRRCAKTLSDSESRPSLSSFFRQFPSINSSGQLTPPPRDSINCSSSLSGLSFLKHLPLRLFGRFCGCLWSLLYATFQTLIIFLFAPNPEWITPQPSSDPRGRIAIVGAGITGISSAAHFLAHGFEVVIFEQSETIGGIWARVNSTSSLQLHSFMYRFHPSVTFPNQFAVRKGVILSELQKVWNNYRLSSRTHFNFTVTQVTYRQASEDGPRKWIINGGADGEFDGLVVAVGTCGPAQRINFAGRELFEGVMIHSSQLDHVDWPGKRVVVIGGGASAVEAVELAVKSGCATPALLVTRTDKWIVPRNVLLCALLSLKPVGRPWLLDYITESAIRTFHYGANLKWMSPAAYNGKPADRLYTRTPICNDEFLNLVRTNGAEYIRAKIDRISAHGVEIHRFGVEEPETLPADVIVEVRWSEAKRRGPRIVGRTDEACLLSQATGYKQPNLAFLPTQQLFRGPKGPNQYAPPNLFLQHFVANNWSCLMTNAGYCEGIGTVGHIHIGISARMMMMFLLDNSTAPSAADMQGWVERVIKAKGSLSFFTWPWLPFVAFGWGGLRPVKSTKTL